MNSTRALQVCSGENFGFYSLITDRILDDLCNQFSMMMPQNFTGNPIFESQPHSTGHSPFSSPYPWPARQQSAHDLSTPVATDQ